MLHPYFKRLNFRRRSPGLLLFLVLWCTVLAIPQLRIMLRVQTLGSKEAYPLPWAATFEGDAFSPTRLTEEFPNNLSALAARTREEKGRNQTAGYDELIRGFPSRAWLIAARLKSTMKWLKDERLGGDFANPKLPRYAKPSPESTGKKPGWTHEELQAAIKIARLGEKLDPDNCFFDWVLIQLLLSDYRDQEAYTVLHRGSLKPRFDNYFYDDLRSAIAARQLVRPLLVEEKAAILISDVDDYDHFVRMRHLCRVMSWEAWKAERAGKHASAIAIRTDLARFWSPQKYGRRQIISALVASAMQGVTWGGIRTAGLPQRKCRHFEAAGAEADCAEPAEFEST